MFLLAKCIMFIPYSQTSYNSALLNNLTQVSQPKARNLNYIYLMDTFLKQMKRLLFELLKYLVIEMVELFLKVTIANTF